jgi:hypothetical protein
VSSDLPIAAQPVLDLRLWLRGLRDRSGHGNHAAVNGTGLYWVRRGRVDGLHGAPAGRLLVADSASLQHTGDVTVFVAGDWRRAMAGAVLAAKRDAGGVQWALSAPSASQLAFADGVATSVATVPYVRSETVAVTSVAGAAPRFFADGVFAAVGDSSISVTADDADLAIGNDYLDDAEVPEPMMWILVVHGALADDQVEALHAWWLQQVTPELRTPGMGYRYPRGRVNVISDGDMEKTTVDPADWAAVFGADLTKSTDRPYQKLRSLQVKRTLAANAYARQTAFEAGKLYHLTGAAWSNGASAPYVYVGGLSADFVGTSTPDVWQPIDCITRADGIYLLLQSVGGGIGDFCRFDNIIASEVNPPYALLAGELAWRDAIETARVSLKDWTAGELGMSGLTITSGTWRITEDAAGRAAECIADGQVRARVLGADTMATKSLETQGTVTLTKTTTGPQLDATAGAKIRLVELAAA